MTLFRFQSHNVWVSECCGQWVNMQRVGEERNVYGLLYLCSVQYGTRGKCPSFCCKDFFMTYLNCGFMLTSVFHLNYSVRSVRTITCDRPGSANAWITIRIRCWVCCVLNCGELYWAVWLQGDTLKTETARNFTLELDSWRTFSRRLRHYCWEWQWHWWHYWHKLHTVDWQYNLSAYCACGLQDYRGYQWVTTNRATTYQYRCAGKSLVQPTSRCILFDGENILFDASLVSYIYIYIVLIFLQLWLKIGYMKLKIFCCCSLFPSWSG
jgi:hypothetical protein